MPTLCTPGSWAARSSRARKNPRRTSAFIWSGLVTTSTVTTPLASNPGSSAYSRLTDRMSSVAPVTSSTASMTSAVTSAACARPAPPFAAESPRSPLTPDSRPSSRCRIGIADTARPTSIASPNAAAKVVQSIETASPNPVLERQARNQRAEDSYGQQRSRGSGHQRQRERLHQDLSRQTAPTSAECGAQHDLGGAIGGARQDERRRVDARHEQQQRNGAQQQQQRRLHVAEHLLRAVV